MSRRPAAPAMRLYGRRNGAVAAREDPAERRLDAWRKRAEKVMTRFVNISFTMNVKEARSEI
jgi:hypothetical protein